MDRIEHRARDIIAHAGKTPEQAVKTLAHESLAL
jgi:hypothetical protein